MKYKILFTDTFKKSFRKLHKHEQKLFFSNLEMFISNNTHPSLRAKKLKGTSVLLEFSINM